MTDEQHAALDNLHAQPLTVAADALARAFSDYQAALGDRTQSAIASALVDIYMRLSAFETRLAALEARNRGDA